MKKLLLLTTVIATLGTSAWSADLTPAEIRQMLDEAQTSTASSSLSSEELEKRIAKLRKDQIDLENYIAQEESTLKTIAKQIQNLNNQTLEHYLEIYGSVDKNLADNSTTASAHVAVKGSYVNREKKVAVDYRLGFKAVLDGEAGAFADISAVKKAGSYELSASIDLNHNGEVSASILSVTDLHEDKWSGTSLIAGGQIDTSGVITPIIGVEQVGRDIGIGITQFGINVVERTGKNGEDRNRYSTNPVVVIFQEVTGQRSALDALSDADDKVKSRHTWIGRQRPMEEVRKVDSADLKTAWYTYTSTDRTIFVDANPRWHNEEAGERLTPDNLNMGLTFDEIDNLVKKPAKVEKVEKPAAVKKIEEPTKGFGAQIKLKEVFAVDSKALSINFFTKQNAKNTILFEKK